MIIDRITKISFPRLEQEYVTGIASGSLVIDELLADGNIVLGKGISNRFEVLLYGVSDVAKEKIVVTQIIDDVEKPLFVGYVDSAKLDDNNYNRQIVAYDVLYSIKSIDASTFLTEFWQSNSVKNLKTLREELLTWLGIEWEDKALLNDNMSIEKYVDIASISASDLLEMICSLSAVFPNINRSGVLEFIDLAESSVIDLNTEPLLYKAKDSSFEEYTTTINRLQIYDAEGNVIVASGSGDSPYSISNNVFLFGKSAEELQAISDGIYNKIKDISYVPCSVQMLVSDIDYKVGSKVLTDKGEHYIFENSLTGSVLIDQTIKCTGTEKLSEVGNNVSLEYIITNSRYMKLEKTVDELALEIGKSVTPNVGGRNLLLGSKDLYGKVIFNDYLSLNGTILIDGKDTLVV